MIAFLGLGNPGSTYADTKHNAGFWIVDELARRWNLRFKPGKGDYVYTRKNNGNALLVKPTTGMNKSGLAVKTISRDWDISVNELHVVVDDVDLPLGKMRIRPKGGDGCHRGMESIIYHMGSTHFPRIRYGVAAEDHRRPAEKYVLKPFRKKDRPLADEMIHITADAAESVLYAGLDKTMNKYNS
ncbi:MAG: aminoacyl-tRNA hydrolase [Candidatus Marinimicrobia bacterium]|jgi:PTH1 family peptidyl-tRNA hydrolase|nr:aminoacyl-tRNA hydrolase [Candidatus Neomarinimicrobiota bacterium]|tara:strand:+ start:1897 stop:2451 length:555 start_codon:yes stop_codon:yes gene_type:complete